jgi:hypothetical protein
MPHAFRSTPATHTARQWLRLLLLVILLTAFTLRLHELILQNIWWDEARNIDVALRPFSQIATAPELDIQPPVYFWLLHLLAATVGLHMGDAPVLLAFVCRFLSVAGALVATAWLYPLGRLTFSRQAGVYAALIATFSPFWLAESQETRMYTVWLALLAGAAVMFLQVIRYWGLANRGATISQWQSSGRRSRILFVLLSALALLTHYKALFVLVAWYSWWALWALLQKDRWRQLRLLLFCGVATGLLVAPILPIAMRQIPVYANSNLTIPTLSAYLWQTWQATLSGYAFDPAILYDNGLLWLWVVLGMLIIGLILDFTRHTPHATRHTPHATSFLLTWITIGLAGYYIAVLQRGAFNVRYSSFVTPALYVLLGGALARVRRCWRPLGSLGLIVLLVGMIPGLYADLYDPRFAREDIVGVTQWLRQVAGPDDLILVDQKYPFGFYYQRYTLDPAATPSGAEPAPARYFFVDIHTVDQRLNEWAAQTKQIFWVQWFESDTDPRHAVPFLLDQVGQRGAEQDFQGYSIDRWTLTPPNHFALAPNLTPLRAAFPPAVETVAVSLPTSSIKPGHGVPVVIQWRRTPSGQINRPLKARVALYDAKDARLAQSDERLLNDRHVRPDQWQAGDQPLNVYLLNTPDDLPPGLYKLRLLVYDAETLEPLSLVDDAGKPAGLEAGLGQVQIEP